MERKTYNSLDLMKIIASILVVAIHAEPLNGLSKDIVIDVFARVAVPFFFITSSFFFFKGYHDKQALLRYIRCLALLYMFWFVVTLPITVLNSFIEPDTSFAHNLLRFIRGFFLGSTFRGSWFLMALMECISFIWLLSRRLHTPTLLFIGICMYTISVLFSSYCFFPTLGVTTIGRGISAESWTYRTLIYFGFLALHHRKMVGRESATCDCHI